MITVKLHAIHHTYQNIYGLFYTGWYYVAKIAIHYKKIILMNSWKVSYTKRLDSLMNLHTAVIMCIDSPSLTQ